MVEPVQEAEPASAQRSSTAASDTAATSPTEPQQQMRVASHLAPPPFSAPPPYHPYAATTHTNSSTIALAVTAGTVLGVTAAAAVRWLNGGDFVLFPPAIVDDEEEDAVMVFAGTRTAVDRNSSSVNDLIERVKNQTDRQQQAVNKLQEVVDHLEQQQQTPVATSLPWERPDTTTAALHAIRDQLAEVQDELRTLRYGSSLPSPCEERLTTTLDQLDATLRLLQTDEGEGDTSSPPESPLHTTFSHTPIRVSTDSTTVVPTAAANTTQTTILSTRQALCTAICSLVHSNDTATLRTGAQLLYLYVVNVQRNPRIPRYRRIYTANESFQQSVAPLEQVGDLLRAVGFVLHDEEDGGAGVYWEWLPPSVHAQQDDSTKTATIEPSPKQAWLSDSEAIYLERLKEAEQALGVLKVWNSSHTEDPATAALEAAGYTPPPLSPPAGTSILSPPDTKKHSSLASPAGFTEEEPPPPMPPILAAADGQSDAGEDETGVFSPVQLEDHGEVDAAAAVLWK